MPDLRRYWQEIRALQNSLPEFVWVMSVEDAVRRFTGGTASEVSSERAALLLHAKSHRLATDQEIRHNKESGDAENRAAANFDLQKRGVAVVRIRPARSPLTDS
jgi:hypothetical protein